MTDLYVATTGNDSNDGTSASPFATITHALSAIPLLVNDAFVIHLADGTYAEGIAIAGRLSALPNSITILGNTSTPANVQLSGSVTYPAFRNQASGNASVFITGGVNVTLNGLTTTGSLSGTYAALIQGGASVTLQSVDVESTGNTVGVSVQDGSSITLIDIVTINVTNQAAGSAATFGIGSIGLQLLYGSRVCLKPLSNSSQIWIKATTAGTSQATQFWGVHAAYGSHVVEDLAYSSKLTVRIDHAYVGVQLGLSSSFQMQVHPGYLLLYNDNVTTLKTDGSSGVLATDNSSFSVGGDMQIQGFQYGVNVNSLSYAEFNHSLSANLARYYISTNVSAGLGGVTSGW